MKDRDFSTRVYTASGNRFHLYKSGSRQYEKVSYPLHCGIYSEIETPQYRFHFNLNNEIIRISGRSDSWPHPQEWLKRTAGNDWVYYSTGGYTGVFETTGEYYLPNLNYPTNKYLGGNPFTNPVIRTCIQDWHTMLTDVLPRIRGAPDEAIDLLEGILLNSPGNLASKAGRLAELSSNCTSVLPPDTRHVDYNVIPLCIARGCLHKCRFCRVKNAQPFSLCTREEISAQIAGLGRLYGADLDNYNSLFLGEHDSLLAPPELILFAIREAHRKLGLTNSAISGCNTFLFGSAHAFLEAPQSLFTALESLPGSVYINIGLESADQDTLDLLGKPIESAQVIEAFDRMQNINAAFTSIEITANFVMGKSLGKPHYDSLFRLIRDRVDRPRSKGCVYLSPLEENDVSRSRLFDFYRFKILSRLPLFLYMIQRL